MSRPDLIEIVGELGQPPHGVDLETYAIAEVDPSQLRTAIRAVTPSYEELESIKEGKPDLYQVITEEPQPEWKLGEGIALKQQLLSRPRRVAAILLTGLALASSAGAANYEVQRDVRQDFPALKDDKPIGESIAVGGIAGAAGGFIASFVGLGFAHRLARKPAKKLVREAESRS